MKVKLLVFLGLLSLQAEAAAPFKTQNEMISYGIGVSVMRNLKKQGDEVDVKLVIEGIKDGASGKALRIPDRELKKLMNQYQAEVRQKMMQSRRIALEDNKKKEQEYLEKHKSEPGVQELSGGILYKVIKEGTGAKPDDISQVLCNYRGTLLDGTEFDATEPGHPATLKLTSMIAGWKTVMKAMPEGSKWQVAIPAAQAYGERGVGTEIGPNEMLLFDIELIAIKQPGSVR